MLHFCCVLQEAQCQRWAPDSSGLVASEPSETLAPLSLRLAARGTMTSTFRWPHPSDAGVGVPDPIKCLHADRRLHSLEDAKERMARYTGPVCRLCRREGMKLFLKGDRCMSAKCAIERRNTRPGQHGQARSRKMSGHGLQLREKQKVRRTYGMLEQQFSRF